MSSSRANATNYYCNHNAEQAIGGTALYEQWQGDKGVKESRTSN
jgi:hypothetical protein